MEWISVEDALPHTRQAVLLYAQEAYPNVLEMNPELRHSIYCGYFDGKGWVTIYCLGRESISKLNEKQWCVSVTVTHWMPLPKPPKMEAKVERLKGRLKL